VTAMMPIKDKIITRSALLMMNARRVEDQRFKPSELKAERKRPNRNRFSKIVRKKLKRSHEVENNA
jgi:hypothetical protein